MSTVKSLLAGLFVLSLVASSAPVPAPQTCGDTTGCCAPDSGRDCCAIQAEKPAAPAALAPVSAPSAATAVVTTPVRAAAPLLRREFHAADAPFFALSLHDTRREASRSPPAA